MLGDPDVFRVRREEMGAALAVVRAARSVLERTIHATRGYLAIPGRYVPSPDPRPGAAPSLTTA